MITDQELNVKIAEACGWERREHEEMQMHFPGGMKLAKVLRWFFGKSLLASPHNEPPDYCNDLNACHEMEKTLLSSARARSYYERELVEICASDSSRQYGNELYHATARQRTEAFARVKGIIIEG